MNNNLGRAPMMFFGLTFGLVGSLFAVIGFIVLVCVDASEIDGSKALFCAVFVGMGLLFAAIGFASLAKTMTQIRLKRLKETGIRLSAQITGCERGTVVVNGRPAYSMTCACLDTNGIYRTFVRENFFMDPTLIQCGSYINVYIDQNDPEKYYVDLDEIPQDVTM